MFQAKYVNVSPIEILKFPNEKSYTFLVPWVWRTEGGVAALLPFLQQKVGKWQRLQGFRPIP
jgi:hypothetical protein